MHPVPCTQTEQGPRHPRTTETSLTDAVYSPFSAIGVPKLQEARTLNTVNKREMLKNYRKLALQLHPDRCAPSPTPTTHPTPPHPTPPHPTLIEMYTTHMYMCMHNHMRMRMRICMYAKV